MSTLLQHYDELLERADQTVDDEYQTQVMHRANTLSTFFTVYLSYACSLILAWCLPGNYTLFSVAPVMVPFFAYMESSRWMKHRAPRPRPWKMNRVEIAIVSVFLFLWILGLSYRNPDMNFTSGLLIGACAGGVFGFVGMTLKMRRDRKNDQLRLEAELED